MNSLGIPLLPLAALWLAACPIPPDFPVDAGPDSGSALIVDAGVDGGGASDSARATLTTSSSTSSTSLAWNGSDLASTSIDDEGSAGPSQVTISASNGFSGSLRLTLGGLVPGSASEQVLSITYQPASGPDSWTCNASSNCAGQVALSAYDGSVIAGTFTITFPPDAFGFSAELSNGNFEVTLP